MVAEPLLRVLPFSFVTTGLRGSSGYEISKGRMVHLEHVRAEFFLSPLSPRRRRRAPTGPHQPTSLPTSPSGTSTSGLSPPSSLGRNAAKSFHLPFGRVTPAFFAICVRRTRVGSVGRTASAKVAGGVVNVRSLEAALADV